MSDEPKVTADHGIEVRPREGVTAREIGGYYAQARARSTAKDGDPAVRAAHVQATAEHLRSLAASELERTFVADDGVRLLLRDRRVAGEPYVTAREWLAAQEDGG